MKKVFLILTTLVLTTTIKTNTANAQALEEGNIVIEGYYGFPNLYSITFKTAYANSGSELDLKTRGLGPVGGRFEYLISDKFGLGLDIGFNNTVIEYRELGVNNNGDDVLYNYEFSTRKLGVMATMNYHFIDNDNLDLYAMVGVGYGNRVFEFKSNDPDYISESVKGLIPVASRLGVGMRYFFTDNLGANLNLGFGQGGLINAGLSVKF